MGSRTDATPAGSGLIATAARRCRIPTLEARAATPARRRRIPTLEARGATAARVPPPILHGGQNTADYIDFILVELGALHETQDARHEVGSALGAIAEIDLLQ